MQKWEYCVIAGIKRDRLEFRGFYSVLWHFTSNRIEETKIGKENISENAAEVARTIAQLGEQGWEMTGIGQSNYRDEHILYFKRFIE